MNSSRARVTAALCGAAAALVLALGPSFDGAPVAGATAATPIAPPAPSDPEGALPVKPAGGGGCVIGLNCGCIRNITCPKAPAHPPGAVRDKRPDPAPMPQNP